MCIRDSDLLDLESLNNCQEARDAFPREVLDTAGYPVVCCRYGAPTGQRTIDEKNTISKSKQLMGFQCQCHKVSDKCKDHSGHAVTSGLSIIPNEDLIQDFKRGTKYRPYANAFEKVLKKRYCPGCRQSSKRYLQQAAGSSTAMGR